MKAKTQILIMLSVLLVSFSVFAQTPDVVPAVPDVPAEAPAAPAPAPALSALLLLISGLVPALIFIIRQLTDKLPPWSLPIVAPLLGMLLDYIGSLITGNTSTPLVGAALGLAGVGVREAFDQVSRRITNGKAVAILLLASLSLGMTGCGTVQVKEGHDPIVVHAEYLAENGLNSVNQFLQWELNHEAAWAQKNRGIHEFAQSLRADAVGEKGLAELQIIELRRLTEEYKKDRTSANGDKVKLATATVLNLVNTARNHAGLPPIQLPSAKPSVRDLMKNAPPQ